MYERTDPVSDLVHLYVDGAFSRRELMDRLKSLLGSSAAAAAALLPFASELKADGPDACPADVKVPIDAPDVIARDVQFNGDAGTLFGHLAMPRNLAEPKGGILVIHENRGLVEHIKDVTRRVARAGFPALSVDLLSRQGGVERFPDPAAQTAAYNRTNRNERMADMFSAMTYLKTIPGVRPDKIGAVGFCAGGGNVFDIALYGDDLSAAVVYYGAPPEPLSDFARLRAPLLGLYGQRDRNFTTRIATLMPVLLDNNKQFSVHVYEGAAHAFNNDTGANYNAEAACDAWSKTIAWYRKFLA
ncbi:MAG: dienelactone hydrolase family protein [Bryobacter sp.]|nr:dienelactone hydrolase family protein [Bryobacter sp.]